MTRQQDRKPEGTGGVDRPVRRIFELSPEDDVRREIEFHLDCRAEALEDRGWQPSEARQEARRRFGDREAVESACVEIVRKQRQSRRRQDMWGAVKMDLIVAFRSLRKDPAFSLLAIAVLALGIGANTAVFSVVDGVLLSPLPFAEPQRLVDLSELSETGRGMRVAYPNFRDWQEKSTSFEAMAVYSGWPGPTTVEGGEQPVRAIRIPVSAQFFPILGVEPALGRTFLPEESREGGDRAIVVSDRFWRRHLGSVENLEGQSLRIGGNRWRVVGVMPEGFSFPEGVDLWTPQELSPATGARTAHNWAVLARLRDGVSRATAQQEMSNLGAALQEEHAGDNDAFSVAVTDLREEVVGSSRRALLLLSGAAALVLLVACSNLASTLLARALSRRREMAVRAAMGAGRRRVYQQLLTEAFVLTGLGTAAGLGLAVGLVRLMRVVRPYDLPRLQEAGVDTSVLFFTLAISLAVGLGFGAIPARYTSRIDLNRLLSEGARGVTGGARWFWRVLIGAEVALAVVLLVGSGLLVQSLWNLLSVDPGFETEEVLTVDYSIPNLVFPGFSDMEKLFQLEGQVEHFSREMLSRLEGVPGVQAASLVTDLPLSGSGSSGAFFIEGRSQEDAEYAGYRVVGGAYFKAMGIPLLEGRSFDARDDLGPHAVVINESLARRHWPDESPLGKRFSSGGMDLHPEDWMTVVGVVGDVRHRSLATEPRPEYFVPYQQRALRAMGGTLVLRTAGPPEASTGAVRAALRELAPTMPVTLSILEERIHGSTAEARFNMLVLGGFALLALLLAGLGIYGVVSYSLTQREREMGIRLALGARPSRVIRLVVGGALRPVVAGAVAGILLSAIGSRLIAHFLFGVLPAHPPTHLAVLALLLVIAALAAYLPARRIAAIDPATTVRDA